MSADAFKAGFPFAGNYVSISEWDRGYLVVMAKYKHNAGPEEEYIDLVPVLEDLYIDSDTFLDGISEVSVEYD